VQSRISLSPESRDAEDARYWATFSDIALAMLLVFMLFILAQFLHYQRIFVLEEVERRRVEVAERLVDLDAKSDSIAIVVTKEGDLQQRLRVSGALRFDSCSERLQPASRTFLEELGALLGEFDSYLSTIEVEGHADRLPATGEACVRNLIDDNWQLSARRATEVVRVFAVSGLLPSEKLSSVGKGEFHPLSEANDTTREGRELDRRIEILLQYSDSVEAAPGG
jgi:chemotaxis protein MotB